MIIMPASPFHIASIHLLVHREIMKKSSCRSNRFLKMSLNLTILEIFSICFNIFIQVFSDFYSDQVDVSTQIFEGVFKSIEDASFRPFVVAFGGAPISRCHQEFVRCWTCVIASLQKVRFTLEFFSPMGPSN